MVKKKLPSQKEYSNLIKRVAKAKKGNTKDKYIKSFIKKIK